VAKKVQDWIESRGSDARFIDPGSPWQNGHNESFNGVFRDGCLNRWLFESVREARETSEAWLSEYNEERPHLDGQAANLTQPLVPVRWACQASSTSSWRGQTIQAGQRQGSARTTEFASAVPDRLVMAPFACTSERSRTGPRAGSCPWAWPAFSARRRPSWPCPTYWRCWRASLPGTR
jgi:hypothetical protein